MNLEWVDAAGRKWNPYDVVFDSPDGQFAFSLYAISEEHARLQLASLKENARIEGRIIDVISDEGDT